MPNMSVGNWVSGDNFWGRQQEKILLEEYIKDGNHVSIMAQRRIGKTSLMHEVGRLLENEYIVLHVDVQDARDSSEMIIKLFTSAYPYLSKSKKFANQLEKIFNNLFGKIESLSLDVLQIQLRDSMVGNKWKERGNSIFESLANLDKSVVVFIDELPILISRILEENDNNKALVSELLSWLRAQALNPICSGKISMVFAGSIGLEPILRNIGLISEINHLTPFTLNPWSDEEAETFLIAIASQAGLKITKKSCLRILELLGSNIPHHVQLFYSKIHEHCKKESKSTITMAIIDSVYEKDMLGNHGHAELAHMEMRLKMVIPDVESHELTRDILSQTALKGFITTSIMGSLWDRHKDSRAEMRNSLQNILGILEHDGYLKRNKDKSQYLFVSNLLRDWWKDNASTFFTPVE